MPKTTKNRKRARPKNPGRSIAMRRKYSRSAVGNALAAPMRLFQWRSWAWLFADKPRAKIKHQWQSVTSVLAAFYSFVVKVPWVLAILVIVIIVVRGLTVQTTVIEPISVPRELADAGYTPEVAARQLRDALHKYVNEASSLMGTPELAMRGDLPDIVVPTVGISLDAIVASIRTLLRSTRSRTITGELFIKENNLSLQLRLDGEKLDTGDIAVYPRTPETLMEIAAPKVVDRLTPYLVALSLERKGNTAAALAKANEIIFNLPESDVNVVWAYNLKGHIYLTRGQRDLAIAAFEKALAIDRWFALPHTNLGVLYKNEGDVPKAIVAFRNAIRIDRTIAIAHYNLGVVLSDPKEKEAAYRLAIKYNPRHASAYNNLGNLLKNLEQSETAFRLAIKYRPDYELAHVNLGWTLAQQDRHDEAIIAYRKAIGFNPNRASAYQYLGHSLRKIGEIDEAIAAYREAIDIEPTRPDYYESLADTLRENSRYDEAAVAYRNVIERQPNSVSARVGLGRVWYEQRKYDEAIAILQEALKLDPQLAVARDLLNELQGLKERAGSDAPDASRIAPKSEIAVRPVTH